MIKKQLMHGALAIAAFALAQATVASVGASSAGSQSVAAAQDSAAATVKAGTYKIDPDHTQVIWSVDHMGFSRLYGMVGGMSGTVQIDPARLAQSKLEVEIPLSGLTVTSSGFATHLQSADLFDTKKYPTARFVSKSVTVRGQQATIRGDFTLRGVTRPLTLQARFYGQGSNPRTKAQTVGFSAKGQLKRSDFGLGYAIPAVSDVVDLEITAAFEKVTR